MSGRTLRRWSASVGRFLLLLVMVTFGIFLLLELTPGNPIDSILPPDATPEQIAEAKEQYGLNGSLLERYLSWIGGVVHGDFGRSFQTGGSVSEMILERVGVSLELAVLAVVVALVVSIPVGIWSAYRPRGVVDRVSSFVIAGTLATPSFVLGIVLAYIVGLQLGVLPLLGWVPFSEDPVGHVKSLILPVITLAAAECVLFTQLLKSDMGATLKQDHVLSARARGLPTRSILTRHSLRQSSFSLVTVSGVVLGRLIGGTVIVETIFSLPGLGTMVITAINARDYIVVQAVVLLTALVYLLMNTLVDVSYPLLDPRVRKVGAR